MRASPSSALSVETTLPEWHAAQSAVANFNFEAHADEVPRVDAHSLVDRDVLAQQLATAPLGAVLVENAYQLPRELTIEQLGRRHNGLPGLMKNWWNKPVRLWTCGAVFVGGEFAGDAAFGSPPLRSDRRTPDGFVARLSV